MMRDYSSISSRLRLLALTLVTLFSGGLFAAETDENGLTPYVWWKFDGDATNYGSRSVSFMNYGSSYVLTRQGQALTSTTGYGNNDFTPGADGGWTLTCAAKILSTDNAIVVAIGKRTNSNYGLALASAGSNKISLSAWTGDTAHEDLKTINVEDSSTKYHFYAVSVSGTEAKIYVDGELKDTATIGMNPSTGDYQLGSIHSGINNTGFASGSGTSYDDVRYYQQALTAEQIANIAASFPAFTGGTKTVEAGAEWTLTADDAFDTLTVGAGAKIDLNGFNLRVGTGNPTSFGDNGANLFTLTNSNDKTLSTLTCGLRNGTLGFNKTAILGGNLKYIMTGSNSTHFRTNNEKRDDAVVPNYHTGGTVISNRTVSTRFHNNTCFGSGPIIFYDSCQLFLPSQNAAYGGTYSNDIQVFGENVSASIGLDLTGTYTFNGVLSGNGNLKIEYTSNDRKPTMNNNMDMSAFEGTFTWKSPGSNGSNWRGARVDMPNGSLVLADSDVRIKPFVWSEEQQKDIESKPGTIEYGNLTTTSSNPEDHANTKITCQIGYATTTLKIGSLGQDGTYSGSFDEETGHSAKWAIEKVGDGTWTLNGASLTHQGATTVSAGRLNVNSTGWGTSLVTVKSGATLGGTGTIPTAVTIQDGGTIAGSLKLYGGVTFSGAGTVEVAAGESITTTSVIDASTLTVKLTGTLDQTQEYTILTAGSGSSGENIPVVVDNSALGWSANWVDGNGDTKVLQASYTTPKIDVDDKEVGYVEGTTAVITNTAASTITLPTSGLSAVSVAINGTSGNAVLVSSGLTLTTANVTVYATDANGNKIDTTITSAFKVTANGSTYTVALDENGSVGDVKVKPELNTEDEQPMSIADGNVGLAVKTIPGLWYAMESCDTPAGSYGVVEASIQQADNSGTTSLSCAMEQEATVKFYKVVTGASKASLTTND